MKPPRSPIAHDQELAAFIRLAAARMPQKDIPEACRRMFGADRAPSRTAINRYLVKHTTTEERTYQRERTGTRSSGELSTHLEAIAKRP